MSRGGIWPNLPEKDSCVYRHTCVLLMFKFTFSLVGVRVDLQRAQQLPDVTVGVFLLRVRTLGLPGVWGRGRLCLVSEKFPYSDLQDWLTTVALRNLAASRSSPRRGLPLL